MKRDFGGRSVLKYLINTIEEILPISFISLDN